MVTFIEWASAKAQNGNNYVKSVIQFAINFARLNDVNVDLVISAGDVRALVVEAQKSKSFQLNHGDYSKASMLQNAASLYAVYGKQSRGHGHV